MPEGPELRINSLYINQVCKGKEFSGEVLKSAVSKCCEVRFKSPHYTITSESRGKEMCLHLSCMENPQNTLRILFRFGMSGRFQFGPVSSKHKHAHLNFFTADANVLSFVDARRFGSWHVTAGWSQDRGPDPMYEYDAFRANVLEHLDDSAFNRPICEVLLNQKYFNGIGNYLRAEILFRACIPPFTRARDVLESIATKVTAEDIATSHDDDMLWLCHVVPLEVIDLKAGLGKVSDIAVSEADYKIFTKWLRCYENPEMNRLSDHNKRTIWYKIIRKARRSRPAGMKKGSRNKKLSDQVQQDPDVTEPASACSEAQQKIETAAGDPLLPTATYGSNTQHKAVTAMEDLDIEGVLSECALDEEETNTLMGKRRSRRLKQMEQAKKLKCASYTVREVKQDYVKKTPQHPSTSGRGKRKL